MKNFTFFIISFFICSFSLAQPCPSGVLGTFIDFNSEPSFDIVEAEVSQNISGLCKKVDVNGRTIDGNLNLGVNVGLTVGADELFCAAINDARIDLTDFISITPSFSCDFNLLNVSGPISAYNATADPIVIFTHKVNATVKKNDIIQVFSPENTEIELRVTASVALAAVQTFCDPGNSVAEAKANVTASMGGISVTTGGIATVSGAFLSNVSPSNTKVLSVPISAGVSTYDLNLSGTLSVKSEVKAVNGILVCASNAVAIADGDGAVTVSNFTGPNGGPLPNGMTIIGLNSGIDYANPTQPLPCLDIPSPEIVVENDSCGFGTGSANITNNLDTLNYEWSNGTTDTQVSDLTYGTHSLNVSDTSGCSRDFYFFVDDPEAPEIVLPEFLVIENNESVILISTDTTDTTLTYLWSTGETTPTIEVSNEGDYSVTITTATGCEYVAETLVQESTPIDFSRCIEANYLFSGNADDISGNNNDATVFGATLTEDRNGRPESAYYFDGIDDYIEFPASDETQPESELTFTAWFKSDDLPEDNWGTIVKNTGQGYEATLNKIKTGGISSSLDLQSGNSLDVNSRSNNYTDNEWHSLAITYNGNSGIYRLFIDGNLNDERLGNMDTISYQANTPFTIGRNGISNNHYFKGAIDDVRIFHCALNVDELSFLFTQQQNFDCYTEIYSEDFEGEIGNEWSDSITHQLIHPAIDTVNMLGQFVDDTISLTLPNVPINSLVSICFDSWSIDSWNGHGPSGPDILSVNISGGRSLIYTTFSNWSNNAPQTYPSDYRDTNIQNSNPYGTGAEIAEDINGEWNYLISAGDGIESKYKICRTFFNIDDTLRIAFIPQLTQTSNNEFWGLDNVSVLILPTILNTQEKTITCNSDGSYIVSVPFTSNGDNINYMAYEQGNTFGDIDTLFFTDDGAISSIEMPYPSGRDYNIVIAAAGDMSDCYPVISGTTECTFTESCNLSATFTDECVGDSLIITGTITGGAAPYSVYSEEYSTVLFPDDGDSFTFTIPSCFPQFIDFTITDFNMCEYTENTVVNTEFPTNESSCLQSLTLHPNPVKSELYISFSEFCANSNIKIYDSLGQLIRSDVLTGNSISYDVNALPKGMYFLHIDNDEDGHVEKFVKI